MHRYIFLFAFLAIGCTHSIGVHASAAQAAPYADRIRVRWSGSDTHLSADGSKILGDHGEVLAPLKPDDDLYVIGKFNAGERLPDGSYVIENAPRPGMVALTTTGIIVGAALAATSIAGLSILCSDNSRCTDPIEPEAALGSIAVGAGIALFVVSIVALTSEIFREPVIKPLPK